MTIHEERIQRVETALLDYMEINDSYSTVIDLLSDLHHYCADMNFTFDECLWRSKKHYEVEVVED